MSVRVGWRNSRIFWDGEYSLFSSRNVTSVSFVSPPKARIAELPRLLPFPGGPIINQWSRLGASLLFRQRNPVELDLMGNTEFSLLVYRRPAYRNLSYVSTTLTPSVLDALHTYSSISELCVL